MGSPSGRTDRRPSAGMSPGPRVPKVHFFISLNISTAIYFNGVEFLLTVTDAQLFDNTEALALEVVFGFILSYYIQRYFIFI